MSTAPIFVWSHCNDCGQETKHDVVHRADRRRSYGDDEYMVEAGSIWKVIQCRGCEEVSLQRVDWCSEDDPSDGPNPATFFPARVSRRTPDWISRYEVSSEYVDILSEVYTALHADSRRLAMMGARALIDMVIRRSIGDQDNFGKGLDELVVKDLISERDRKIIEAAIDAGHASAHRGHNPSPENINVVIDIVERMIHAEILTDQAKFLKETTPQRKPRTT